MSPRVVFRWLGLTALYTLTLWGLWGTAALVARTHSPSATVWVGITAVLAPLGLALIGALATGASWWTAIPPLAIGLSLLALTVATSLSPSFAHEAGVVRVLTHLVHEAGAVQVVTHRFGTGANTTVVVLYGLAVLASLLAYGMARVGLRVSQSLEESQRGMVRGFARWLLLGVPLVTLGLATGDGVAFLLGAIALFVAGRHLGLHIELWRYLQ